MRAFEQAEPRLTLSVQICAVAIGRPLAGAFGAAGHYLAKRKIALPWHWTYETPDRRVQLMTDPETAKAILSVL